MNGLNGILKANADRVSKDWYHALCDGDHKLADKIRRANPDVFPPASLAKEKDAGKDIGKDFER